MPFLCFFARPLIEIDVLVVRLATQREVDCILQMCLVGFDLIRKHIEQLLAKVGRSIPTDKFEPLRIRRCTGARNDFIFAGLKGSAGEEARELDVRQRKSGDEMPAILAAADRELGQSSALMCISQMGDDVDQRPASADCVPSVTPACATTLPAKFTPFKVAALPTCQ